MIFEAFNQENLQLQEDSAERGLGLTISKKIVTMLGGDLKLTSESGRSSRFYFTIRMVFSQFNNGFVNEKR